MLLTDATVRSARPSITCMTSASSTFTEMLTISTLAVARGHTLRDDGAGVGADRTEGEEEVSADVSANDDSPGALRDAADQEEQPGC
jgi:hypothetical protein